MYRVSPYALFTKMIIIICWGIDDKHSNDSALPQFERYEGAVSILETGREMEKKRLPNWIWHSMKNTRFLCMG